MKKLTLLAAGLSLAGISSLALAQHGGFTGPRNAQPQQAGQPLNRNATTVAQARQLRDDAKVTLQGHIRSHIRGDLYTFEDASGQITIDIDEDDWNGQQIGPNDRVELHGEVDKDRRSIKIDVDNLRKL